MAEALDFTASLYLGLVHPSRSLPRFASLTTGTPAAARSLPGSAVLAHALARLLGCEDAILAPSTHHLSWDLFSILCGHKTGALLASQAYPVLRWGVERAASRGTFVEEFPQNDIDVLRAKAARLSRLGLRPVIATDGVLTDRGRAAPLAGYLAIARLFGGRLVIDDTQALGILGRSPDAVMPYGRGGGGSLRWHGISGPEVVVVNSLAKGFGVPLAVLAGSRSLVRLFEAASETRVHSSPPNSAEIGAGLRALAVNWRQGDRLRQRLLDRILHFRRHLAELGISADGGLFPVQTLATSCILDGRWLYAELLRRGIRTLLLEDDARAGPRVAFVLTTRHALADIDQAVLALRHILSARAARLTG